MEKYPKSWLHAHKFSQVRIGLHGRNSFSLSSRTKQFVYSRYQHAMLLLWNWRKIKTFTRSQVTKTRLNCLGLIEFETVIYLFVKFSALRREMKPINAQAHEFPWKMKVRLVGFRGLSFGTGKSISFPSVFKRKRKIPFIALQKLMLTHKWKAH